MARLTVLASFPIFGKRFVKPPRLVISTTSETRTFFEVLPPPSGLDPQSIATEAGLLEAIDIQARRIEESKNGGTRITHDEIRLIAFLASEVRRRIDALDPEQREEFERIRNEARQREVSLSVDELEDAIEAFAESTKNPKSVITFSTVSELEMRGTHLKQLLGQSPETYAEFLSRVQQSLGRLEEIKNTGFTGFQSFD